MDRMHGVRPGLSGSTRSRRAFLRNAGRLAAASVVGTSGLAALAAEQNKVTLPFDNGERELVSFPQKRPLILVSNRPPQLETPFAVFNDGVLTPNDAFFVRYHWNGVPMSVDAAAFRLRVTGAVDSPLELSLDALKALGDAADVVAVNQCSGNSRGFLTPRVNGGQLGNGAMGNARWTGIPLKTCLPRPVSKPAPCRSRSTASIVRRSVKDRISSRRSTSTTRSTARCSSPGT